MEEGEPIEHNLISKAIENAQKKVEAHNFDIRKHLLEYDDVMNTQRDIIYSMRREILSGEGIDEVVRTMMEEKVDALIDAYTDPKARSGGMGDPGVEGSTWPGSSGSASGSGRRIWGRTNSTLSSRMSLRETLKEEAWKAHEKRETEFGKEDLKSIEKYILLQIIDHQWVDHLQDMESMKEGIGLRGYGHLDPLREYKKEGFALFEGLMDRIREETLVTLSRIRLMKEKPKEEELPRKRARRPCSSAMETGRKKSETVRREGKKVGRNDPCPCGSGKKYKKCCGSNW